MVVVAVWCAHPPCPSGLVGELGDLGAASLISRPLIFLIFRSARTSCTTFDWSVCPPARISSPFPSPPFPPSPSPPPLLLVVVVVVVSFIILRDRPLTNDHAK